MFFFSFTSHTDTWFIPALIDIDKTENTVTEIQVVELDPDLHIVAIDPIGKRAWLLPPGDQMYSLTWGTDKTREMSYLEVPTGVDLRHRAWISHVVGYIRTHKAVRKAYSE